MSPSPSPPRLIVARSGGTGFGWVLFGDQLIAMRNGFTTRPAAQRDGELFHALLMETRNASR